MVDQPNSLEKHGLYGIWVVKCCIQSVFINQLLKMFPEKFHFGNTFPSGWFSKYLPFFLSGVC